MSISEFSKALDRELSLPTLGTSHSDREHRGPDYKSPAAKEIAAKQILNDLTSQKLLAQIYELLKERGRNVAERARTRAQPQRVRKRIAKLRQAQKTIGTVSRKIREVYLRLGPKDWDVPDELIRSWELLQAAQDRLDRREEFLVAALHPQNRESHWRLSAWKSIAPIHSEVDQSRAQAADKRLIVRLDRLLTRRFQDRLTAMTRYRIIMAVLLSANMGAVEVGAIKQYLISQIK